MTSSQSAALQDYELPGVPVTQRELSVDVVFNAIADHIPNLSPLTQPERLRSGWLNSIRHWQVDYTKQP